MVGGGVGFSGASIFSPLAECILLTKNVAKKVFGAKIVSGAAIVGGDLRAVGPAEQITQVNE